MYDRDYLMRLISQTSVMLARIMGLREQKKPEEALQQLDEFLSRELRMRTRLALGLSDEDVLRMLGVGGTPNYEAVATLAAFMHEEGELLLEMGRPAEALPRFEKALRLMLCVLKESSPVEGLDLEARVRRLLAELKPYETAVETKRAVWQWRENQRLYADAEDLLYELYDHHRGVSSEEGFSFYDRLERRTDEELENGGLSRAELHEGRRQWSALAGETAS